ncbi:hypothetical protein CEXT_258811 [Caerostris extrusa]|uniref:Uncharacterized protein n=1 Tax=Caerostris extrusa TaxID=172846 RepID=A0AAV4WQK8_CAEEX|nr:hypothetical protein CEXT_258811 [Caerostris extrusa]
MLEVKSLEENLNGFTGEIVNNEEWNLPLKVDTLTENSPSGWHRTLSKTRFGCSMRQVFLKIPEGRLLSDALARVGTCRMMMIYGVSCKFELFWRRKKNLSTLT